MGRRLAQPGGCRGKELRVPKLTPFPARIGRGLLPKRSSICPVRCTGPPAQRQTSHVFSRALFRPPRFVQSTGFTRAQRQQRRQRRLGQLDNFTQRRLPIASRLRGCAPNVAQQCGRQCALLRAAQEENRTEVDLCKQVALELLGNFYGRVTAGGPAGLVFRKSSSGLATRISSFCSLTRGEYLDFHAPRQQASRKRFDAPPLESRSIVRTAHGCGCPNWVKGDTKVASQRSAPPFVVLPYTTMSKRRRSDALGASRRICAFNCWTRFRRACFRVAESDRFFERTHQFGSRLRARLLAAGVPLALPLQGSSGPFLLQTLALKVGGGAPGSSKTGHEGPHANPPVARRPLSEARP